jgi:hypothetical protein
MLEIIITGRHDNFGGEDFHERWCAVAAHNHRLLNAFGVEHRFTLVEWNPVDGRALLADLIQERLPWWHHCLIVDREWHQALSTNPHLPFMEFFAKNAGVRRSTADIILTTNSDVFLSTEVVKTLAAKTSFDDRVVYRAPRIDIDRGVDWRTCGESTFADPGNQLRTHDLQPPHYSNAAGDFLLLTRTAWLALGGFNERVRYAKIHKDGQFCVNAWLEGYTFESLGPIYHIDHDGSYTNVGAMRGSPDAPYGPEWDYHHRYRNPASWGISAAIDEDGGNGRVHAHHPASHGPLLSIIVPAPRTSEGAGPDNADNLAAAVNTALATAKGQFVVVTTDPALTAFGGCDSLATALTNTTAGLIVPAGSLVQHPRLGLVPSPGAPYVMRRDLIDALTEWDEAEADPAMAFWLGSVELTHVAAVPEEAVSESADSAFAPPVGAGLQVAALTRRGTTIPRGLRDDVIREHLAANRNVQIVVREWIESVAPDTDQICAIVGPDWATPALLELVHAQNRTLAGVFTALANEEGTWRWGQRLRPLKELAHAEPAYVFAGADGRLVDRIAAVGCASAVHVICPIDDPGRTAPDAELDALRRAQARDLAENRMTAIQARLPLLALLDPQRIWQHRYDAAQAYERVKLPAAALELYREVTADCTTDLALSMRAAFHTARLLIDRGACHQAAPLLNKIVKYNPAHRAARQLLDQITTHELTA